MLLEPKSPRNSRSAALTTLPAHSVWWSTWKLDPAATVNKETTKILNGAGADLEAGKALMAQFEERGVCAARCVNKTEHSQLIAHNVSIFRALGGVLADKAEDVIDKVLDFVSSLPQRLQGISNFLHDELARLTDTMSIEEAIKKVSGALDFKAFCALMVQVCLLYTSPSPRD